METTKIDFDTEIAEFRRQSEESLKILAEHGFVPDTTEWLTTARYAKKYDVSQQDVANWINQGIVPADCVQDLPELKHNIRLIKDQPYR